MEKRGKIKGAPYDTLPSEQIPETWVKKGYCKGENRPSGVPKELGR